jgi:hypothetical protein
MTVLENNFDYTCEENVQKGILLTWINNFDYSNEILTMPVSKSLSDDNFLTEICMESASHSFAEDWENEDDDHWNSFLK